MSYFDFIGEEETVINRLEEVFEGEAIQILPYSDKGGVGEAMRLAGGKPDALILVSAVSNVLTDQAANSRTLRTQIFVLAKSRRGTSERAGALELLGRVCEAFHRYVPPADGFFMYLVEDASFISETKDGKIYAYGVQLIKSQIY